MTQRGRGGARPGSRPGPRRTRDSADQPSHSAGQSTRSAPRIDLVAVRARLRQVIEPVLADAGYDLEDLHVSRAGLRHIVRVLVDTDGGISLDDIAVVSRKISAALDAADESGGEVVTGEYQLEVGSPGVDRPLTAPRHWRRNRGRLVAVNGLTGRVTEVNDAGIVLDVAGAARQLTYAELGPGRVQIEFKRLDEAEFDDDEAGIGDDDGEDYPDEDDEGEGEE